MRTYPADEVDTQIQKLTGLLEESLSHVKQANVERDALKADKANLEKEVEQLRKAAAAAADHEKQSSAQIQVDPLLVKQATAALVEAQLYEDAELEKLAKAFTDDPNTALHIVMALAKDSVPPHAGGHGIAKEAGNVKTAGDNTAEKYRQSELEAFRRIQRFGA